MRTKSRAQARTLLPKEINHAIRIAGIRQQPERNQLVLYLSYAACLRITKIAQIRPCDILTKRGELRESFLLPAAFGKGKTKARRVWLTPKAACCHQCLLSVPSRERELPWCAGLKGASSHSGRRLTATNLNEQGVLIGEIQRLLGHSEHQQTLAYTDIRPERRVAMFREVF